MELTGYLVFAAIMVTGFVIGLALRERQEVIRRVERLTRPVIFLLLFIMGVSIGLDDHTMGNLLSIGLSSLGFALLTSLGSMLLVALVLPVAGKTFRSQPGDEELEREAISTGEALLK